MVERSRQGTSTHQRWHGRRWVSEYTMLVGRTEPVPVAVVVVEVPVEGISDLPVNDDEVADSIMGTNDRRVQTDSWLVRVKKWLVLGNSDWYASELKHSFV